MNYKGNQKHLTLSDRINIEKGLNSRKSFAEIARIIHKDPTTVGLETSLEGSRRTTLYYCDPYTFWQKGCCEKNHEYIRYVRKKGSTFDDLTQRKVTLLANHINNAKRDSLNGHSPFELSQMLLDERLLKAMGLKKISPDEVRLTPELLG